VKVLLDTHVAIWAIANSPRLPPAVREMIAEPTNDIVVSAVTIWEIAIKRALARGGAGDMPISATAALAHFRDAGYLSLSVSAEHCAAVELLPRLHADPFDRLLMAQALSEPARLVTHDPALAAYSDTVILF
jgi:PIN domain nuclease of toxin-antitoxin system